MYELSQILRKARHDRGSIDFDLDEAKIIVDEYIKNREKYGKTLVFAVNKAHAYTLDKEFKKAFKENNLDINSEYCLSGDRNNQEKINKFKNQKDGVFINVQILTEGSDAVSYTHLDVYKRQVYI